MMAKQFLFSVLIVSAVLACSSDDDELIVGDKGWRLVYCKIQPKNAFTNINYWDGMYSSSDSVPSYADLLVFVTDSTETGYSASANPTDQAGRMLQDYILSTTTRVFDGMMPVPIKYTTVACRSVRIMMIDAAGEQHDITPMARFTDLFPPFVSPQIDDNFGRLFVSKLSNFAGIILSDASIEEYLSLSPMLFAVAHFVFPSIPRQDFANAQQVWVEIELEDGRKLISKTQY